jgi:putative copper resistance protein D
VVWLHILAAITWIGGMIFIRLIFSPATRDLPEQMRSQLFQTIGTATKAVGWIAVLILLFTGVLNVLHLQIQWDTLIGRLLMMKLTLVTVMIALSALHDFILGPRLAARLRTAAGQDPSLPGLHRRVAWLARINLLLALAVVYIAVLIARA